MLARLRIRKCLIIIDKYISRFLMSFFVQYLYNLIELNESMLPYWNLDVQKLI